MPKQSVLVATENKKAIEHLIIYLRDTESVPTVIRRKSDLSAISSCEPDLVFVESEWVDKRVASRLDQLRAARPKLGCFGLGARGQSRYAWDGVIDFPVDDKQFQKTVLSKIVLPNPVSLLVVDDEQEVVTMLRDYFEGLRGPQFEVRSASNGLEGFKLVQDLRPHCMILDIKMPVRSGVELYRDICRAGYRIPTIVFINSTASDDIREIRKWGMPVFVEKGGWQSSMPEMLFLVKKLVAFS